MTKALEAAARAIREGQARGALPAELAQLGVEAALENSELALTLAQARHPHLWNGNYERALGKMKNLLLKPEDIQGTVDKRRAEALEWGQIEANSLILILTGKVVS